YYLPGATEDVYEEYSAPPGRDETGFSWSLGGPDTSFGPVNILSGQVVDTAILLRGTPDFAMAFLTGYGSYFYDIEMCDPTGACVVLTEGPEFTLDPQAGIVTFWIDIPDTYFVYVIYQLETYTLEPVSGTVMFLDTLPAGWSLLADYEYGLPIPYSQVYGPAHGYDTFIPGNGDMVAFYGEFDYQQNHGTFVASSVAARPFGNLASTNFEVFGTAPGAKIVGIAACCNTAGPLGLFGAIEDQRTFAALGYDGRPGTGDEAVISVNAFGSSQTLDAGFSWEDRWLFDHWERYTQHTSLAAIGDNGLGYGTTISGGASPGVIGVGAGTSQDYRVLYGNDGGNGSWELPVCPGPPPIDPADCYGIGSPFGPGPYGDILYTSSRGPTLLGTPKPDIVSIGGWAVEAGPLNTFGILPADLDGNLALAISGGTSVATGATAGVVALMAQAYRATHGGVNPTNAFLKEALKSGADDMHRDVLQQGAGWTNASRSVRMAADIDYVSTDVDAWVPGGYLGVSRPAFVNFLTPGVPATTTVRLTNHNSFLARSIEIFDAVYVQRAKFSWTFSLPTGTTNNYVLKPSGVYAGDGATLLQPLGLAPHWSGADFAKITFTYNATAYTGSTAWRLDQFDWYDENGDGLYAGFTERNRMTVALAGGLANSVWDTVYDLGRRVHDGLVLNPRSGAAAAIGATLIVEFYEKADWPWVQASASTLNIPAGGNVTFLLGAMVPPGTPGGLYEGALYLRNPFLGTTTTVPILINVPLTGPTFLLGGNVPATSLYENGGVVQGSRSTGWRQSGDNRFAWLQFDPGLPAANRRMVYNALLQGARSEPEIYAFQLVPDLSWTDAARYGPGTMRLAANTAERIGLTNTCFQPEPRVVTFTPATPCFATLDQEFLHSPVLTGGLYAVQVRSWAAWAEAEPLRGDFGVLETVPVAHTFTTGDLAGSRPFTVWSSAPLYDGLSAVAMERNVTTWTDVAANPDYWAGQPFDAWLCSQTPPNSVSFLVPGGTTSLDVRTWSATPSDDHDLGVWLDANGNGVCDPGVDALIGMGAGPTADERVTAVLPAAGRYFAQVGIFVSGSDRFNLEVTMERIGITPFSVAGPNRTVAPLTLINASLDWDLPPTTPPGTVVVGALFLNPGFAPFTYTQRVDVRLTYQPSVPVISNASAVPDPQDQFLAVNVSATVSGALPLAVNLNVTYPDLSWTNVSMTDGGGGVYYVNRTYDQAGTHAFTITAENSLGVAVAMGTFVILPPGPPILTNVAATPNPQQVFGTVTITATITDPDGVAQATVEVTFPDASAAT
ncbi:MAG: S8 family serine peptidase, partial [Candidatus Thermoplasmatota archaeon]